MKKIILLLLLLSILTVFSCSKEKTVALMDSSTELSLSERGENPFTLGRVSTEEDRHIIVISKLISNLFYSNQGFRESFMKELVSENGKIETIFLKDIIDMLPESLNNEIEGISNEEIDMAISYIKNECNVLVAKFPRWTSVVFGGEDALFDFSYEKLTEMKVAFCPRLDENVTLGTKIVGFYNSMGGEQLVTLSSDGYHHNRLPVVIVDITAILTPPIPEV